MRVRKRLREIEYYKLDELRDNLGMKQKDFAKLLGVEPQQLCNYKRCGRLPADRFYALRDALLIDVEERAREERQMILNALGVHTIA